MSFPHALNLEALRRSFDKGPAAVGGVTLSLAQGQFFCLLGPSGCGKTTLLRLIGGYLLPDEGRILLGGEDVTGLPPERRGIGMVFQNYALFPHLSARGNVSFGLSVRGVPMAERRRRVEVMLDRVGLSQQERDRRPRELSGGQQQRVALARALVIEPRLLLLDEPFANLDRRLRERLRGELKDIQQRTGVTAILVTHDQDEALSLADQVGLMLAGRFLQVATPAVLYQRPLTPLAARFVGEANLLPVAQVEPDALLLPGGVRLRREGLPDVQTGSLLLLRPEGCAVGAEAQGCPTVLSGRVTATSFLGADRLLDLEVAADLRLRARCRPESLPQVRPGDILPLGIRPGALWPIPEQDPPWASALPLTGLVP